MAGSTEKLRLCEADAPEDDTRQHMLKLVLRGHDKPMFFDISAGDVDRLFGAIQRESKVDAERTSFVVFDSDRLRIALNLAAAVFCHFLWEPGLDHMTRITEAEVGSDDDQFNALHVYFGPMQVPVFVNAEPEDGDDVENERNYLNNIFYLLETEPMPNERLHIADVDGESAFIRVGDIALLTAPLWLLDREIRDAHDAEVEE